MKKKSVVTLFGLAVVSVAIWILGPLIAFAGVIPLERPLYRIIVILLIILVVITLIAWKQWSSKKNDKAIISEMLSSNDQDLSDSAEIAANDELATLRRNLEEAITTLKSTKSTNKKVGLLFSELPWYVIIGPPGAGKTTLLENSNLNFPLAEKLGKHSIGGVGGTRNCDWWFTEEAVLLDTAGRYTTQDSNTEVDRKAWTGFLKLLKEKRNRRPINGIIVAIPITEFIDTNNAQLAQLSNLVKQRLDELRENLGVTAPVYLLFTKCDLLRGFTEFFADLDSADREQIWGFTYRYEEYSATSNETDKFSEEFNRLATRLNSQLIKKLQNERSNDRRESIYLFPLQFISLQKALYNFLRLCFKSSRYNEKALLRGVYFTSATQVGSPIDKIMGSLSRTFGLSTEQLAGATGKGKSFFINNLLRSVIFNESGLVGLDLKAESRKRKLSRASTVSLAIAAASMFLFYSWSYKQNSANLEEVNNTILQASNEAKLLKGSDTKIVSTLGLLNIVRNLSLSPQYKNSNNKDRILHSGLFQGEKLENAFSNIYRQNLISVLLPRLMYRMERQMQAVSNDPEYLYEALKIYLMLASDEYYNYNTIMAWFRFDIESNLPSSINNSQKESLLFHISELFLKRPAPLSRDLNEDLIRQARVIIRQISLENRIYNRIKQSFPGKIDGFSVTKSAGRDASLVFTRKSGKALNSKLSAFFSYAGYHDFFVKENLKISENMSAEQWILQVPERIFANDQKKSSIKKKVEKLYLNDFMHHWDEFLSDIRMVPVSSTPHALELIELITDKQSPLKLLLSGIATETNLSKVTVEPSQQNLKEPTTIDIAKNKLSSMFGSKKTTEEVVEESFLAARVVTDHFQSVIDMSNFGGEGGGPLDALIQQLQELTTVLGPISVSGGSVSLAQQAELSLVLQKLNSKAKRQPPLVKTLLKNISEGVADSTGSGLCQSLNTIWQSSVVSFYNQAISNRYPVNPDALYDIAMSDFSSFFGPGGRLDRFFTQHLSPYVRTEKGKLRWNKKPSQPACVSESTLRQYSIANYIRQSFFPTNSNTPNLSIRVSARQVSAAIDKFTLTIGDKRLEFFHGPTSKSTKFNWPEETGSNHVQLKISATDYDGNTSIAFDGPWAILKLLNRGEIHPINNSKTHFLATYNFNGRPVSLNIDAQSSFNPFRNKKLQAFRCPQNLN